MQEIQDFHTALDGLAVAVDGAVEKAAGFKARVAELEAQAATYAATGAVVPPELSTQLAQAVARANEFRDKLAAI